MELAPFGRGAFPISCYGDYLTHCGRAEQTTHTSNLDHAPNYSRVFWTPLQITRTLPTMDRYLKSQVVADLKRKMVFLGGPRQVGKTTLAKRLLRSQSGYFNWDFGEHREKILAMEF